MIWFLYANLYVNCELYSLFTNDLFFQEMNLRSGRTLNSEILKQTRVGNAGCLSGWILRILNKESISLKRRQIASGIFSLQSKASISWNKHDIEILYFSIHPKEPQPATHAPTTHPPISLLPSWLIPSRQAIRWGWELAKISVGRWLGE